MSVVKYMILFVWFAGCCAAQEERPTGISERLFSDPERMVFDSIYGNSIATGHILENPDRFREPLREFAAKTEEPGPLISAAHLAYGLLSDDEFFQIAEKALARLPENGGDLVTEYREGLEKLIEKKKLETNTAQNQSNNTPGTATQGRKVNAESGNFFDAKESEGGLSGLPTWPLIAIVAAILGIVILLVRAFMRGRAS